MSAGGGRSKVWVVRDGDGASVADIVARAGEPPSAVTDGRVFVGRVRATSARVPVRPGDQVTIGPPAREGPTVRTLLAKDGLVAVAKAAGLPTVPDHAGARHSLVGLVADELGVARDQLRVTSRLDREVSGVVVFARDAEAEARLRRAREVGRYVRRYVALACAGAPDLDAAGVWDAPIGRAADPRLRRANGPDAKASRTRFAVVARAGGVALLAVEPETGRTHQIRVHASHAGAPLFGDRAYGGPPRVTRTSGSVVALERIALHAARVTVPLRDDTLVDIDADIPDALVRVWRALGGAPEAWDTARTCPIAGSSSPSR